MKIHHYKMHTDYYYQLPQFTAAFPRPNENQSQEIRRWCYNTYGVPGIRVDTDEMRWRDGILYGEIVFQREEDLSMFLLKWST